MNCLGYAGQTVHVKGENTAICAPDKICTAANLHDEAFYTNALLWNKDAWVFTPGYFPVPASHP